MLRRNLLVYGLGGVVLPFIGIKAIDLVLVAIGLASDVPIDVDHAMRAPTADALLARIQDQERARLRVYIGAAPGVGKTYEMLVEAHALRARGLDVVVGMVETYGRPDTEAQIKDLEVVPRRAVEYRGVTLEEMDVDGIIQRRPQVCVVDELAHSNVPGSRNAKRHEDVLALLDAGIHVMTAVNIQHLETLNDAVARATGVRVRETVPDTFLDRADEVINVDVTVEELRSRLREGKIYRPEKVEQALANFFRKGNLSTLRELALRAVADEVGEKAASYRAREGLEPALIPERVMVCMSSNALAPRVIRTGARIAGRLGSKWYAVYVETPHETPNRIRSKDAEALQQNIRLAESLGATVVRVRAERPAEGLIAFAQREGVTHVIFGQTARSRWELVWRGSTLDRFLSAVPGCRGAGRAARRGLSHGAGGTHSLRLRLLAALLALVAALAGLGAWSAWRLRDMGRVAQRILADNYLSIEAARGHGGQSRAGWTRPVGPARPRKRRSRNVDFAAPWRRRPATSPRSASARWSTTSAGDTSATPARPPRQATSTPSGPRRSTCSG